MARKTQILLFLLIAVAVQCNSVSRRDSGEDHVADKTDLGEGLNGNLGHGSLGGHVDLPDLSGHDIDKHFIQPVSPSDPGFDANFIQTAPIDASELEKDVDDKKNHSMLVPLVLPGGIPAYVHAGALNQAPSYIVAMINGQPMLIQNPSSIGGGSGGWNIGSSSIASVPLGSWGGSSIDALPSWVGGIGGPGSIAVLPGLNQQPVWIGSQYPGMGSSNTGGPIVVPDEEAVPVPVPVPSPEPVPQPYPVPEPVPVPQPVPFPQPVNPGSFNFPGYSWPSLWNPYLNINQTHPMPPSNVGNNLNWSSLINLLLKLVHPHNKEPKPHPYPFPYPYPYPSQYPQPPYPYPYPYPWGYPVNNSTGTGNKPTGSGNPAPPLRGDKDPVNPTLPIQPIPEATTLYEPNPSSESTHYITTLSPYQPTQDITTLPPPQPTQDITTPSAYQPTQTITTLSPYQPTQVFTTQPTNQPPQDLSTQSTYQPTQDLTTQTIRPTQYLTTQATQQSTQGASTEHLREPVPSYSTPAPYVPGPGPATHGPYFPEGTYPTQGPYFPEVTYPTQGPYVPGPEYTPSPFEPRPPHPGHNKPPHVKKPGKSGLGSGLVDILNILLKFPNRVPTTTSHKHLGALVNLLLSILKSGHKNYQLPNVNIELPSLNEGSKDDQKFGSNLAHLLLHILDGRSEPNLNMLVEPGMDESTRANLILLLKLLASNLANNYHEMGYFASGNPLLYFLGHFPCDHPNIQAISGLQSNSNLWQLLNGMDAHNYEEPEVRLLRSAEESEDKDLKNAEVPDNPEAPKEDKSKQN